jgi:agmatinase
MGLGHSHKKKSARRRVRSATKDEQHDLAHLEGKDHHDSPRHEFLPGVHHHGDLPGAQSVHHAPPCGQNWPPFPNLPDPYYPHPDHPEGYPWPDIKHFDCSAPGQSPAGHPHPEIFDPAVYQGAWARAREAELGAKGWKEEVDRCIEYGLEAAPSIKDRTISCFSRGELPHFAGINTFCKTHYLEDVKKVGQFDAAIVGAPFDIGTTFRSGTRFGPQAIRRISALYGTYCYELGVDVRESLKWCDVGDVFTIANIEKGFDQISKAVAHIRSNNVFPIILGGDHSIGYPDVRGIAPYIDGPVGIIHIDRHVDTQETDMDERMHTCPWFHATNIPNAPPINLIQLGIGGWQAPRPGVKVGRSRGTSVLTIEDIMMIGVDKAAEIALDVAWGNGAKAVFLSFDVDSLDAGFVPGTGWPEPGGFLPREVLRLLRLVAQEGLCGMEVVEVAPQYDVGDITALTATRAIMDVIATLINAGKLGMKPETHLPPPPYRSKEKSKRNDTRANPRKKKP